MSSNSTRQPTGFDERMMTRALELAARGQGRVSPSPLVGCVIVDEAGEVVGEGFYLYEGVKHAETLALEEAADRARGANVYVSLEPHSHTGRTPPCTEALISAGVTCVVSTIEDPNPLVSGKGYARLREAGVSVVTGVLAREAAQLNEKYIKALRHQRPFVHLKLATSLDGRIATRTGDARWITSAESRARVHLLRHEYDAILVGAGTVVKDDPLLTDRSGLSRRRPLVRVVLDERLQLTPSTQLARTARESPVVVFTSENADTRKISSLAECGVEVVRVRHGRRDAGAVLDELHRRTIQSVIVEGGASIAALFLEAGLVNKASFFVAPIIIGGREAVSAVGGTGAATVAEAVKLQDVEITRHDSDVEITGYTKAVTSDE